MVEVYNRCGNYCYKICPFCKKIVLCEHCLKDASGIKQFVCSGLGGKCDKGSAFSNPHLNRGQPKCICVSFKKEG